MSDLLHVWTLCKHNMAIEHATEDDWCDGGGEIVLRRANPLMALADPNYRTWVEVTE